MIVTPNAAEIKFKKSKKVPGDFLILIVEHACLAINTTINYNNVEKTKVGILLKLKEREKHWKLI